MRPFVNSAEMWPSPSAPRLRVCFEDNHCLAVIKPAGVLTMGDHTGDVSMVELAREQFVKFGLMLCAVISLATTAAIVYVLVTEAVRFFREVSPIDFAFGTEWTPQFDPPAFGVLPLLCGTFSIAVIGALIGLPIGLLAAIYLEEYGRDSKFKRVIQINLSNLAGVPSIVYGILGLTAFVRLFGLIPAGLKSVSFTCTLLPALTLTIPLPLGSTIITGALTLGLLVLPVIIVAAQEALRAVPSSIRTASYALGATQWQTIRHQVLPASLPGISTGVILALSRAMGESAPLIMVGALTSISFCPGKIESVGQLFSNPQGALQAPFDSFTALPIQIFNWSTRPEAEFQHVAAAGILVLLTVLLCLNTAAIVIRQRFQKCTRW